MTPQQFLDLHRDELVKVTDEARPGGRFVGFEHKDGPTFWAFIGDGNPFSADIAADPERYIYEPALVALRVEAAGGIAAHDARISLELGLHQP